MCVCVCVYMYIYICVYNGAWPAGGGRRARVRGPSNLD